MLTDDERAVLADELQQRGDPQGELIALQLALAQLPQDAPAVRRRALERRLADHLDRHHDAFYGGLAPYANRLSKPDLLRPTIAVRTWNAGFADEVLVRDAALPIGTTLHLLRDLPIARLVRTLEVELLPDAIELGAIAIDPMPGVQRLVLRSGHANRPDVYLDVAPLVAPLTGLEELHVLLDAHRARPFASPTVRRLVFSLRLGETLVAELPALEDLVLHGQPDPGLLERYPRLARLTVIAPVQPGWLERILSSERFAQLRQLDFKLYRIDERTLATLVANADRLHGIELRVDASGCPHAVVEAARGVLPANVILR